MALPRNTREVNKLVPMGTNSSLKATDRKVSNGKDAVQISKGEQIKHLCIDVLVLTFIIVCLV